MRQISGFWWSVLMFLFEFCLFLAGFSFGVGRPVMTACFLAQAAICYIILARTGGFRAR